LPPGDGSESGNAQAIAAWTPTPLRRPSRPNCLAKLTPVCYAPLITCFIPQAPRD
jgi:hypothetical protein